MIDNEEWARYGGLDEHVAELRQIAMNEKLPSTVRNRAALVAEAITRTVYVMTGRALAVCWPILLVLVQVMMSG